MVYLYAQERTGISYSFAKKSMSLLLVIFEKSKFEISKFYVNLTSNRIISNSRGRARFVALPLEILGKTTFHPWEFSKIV